MRVHVVETGRLVANKTFWRGQGLSTLLRRREDFEIPVLSYVVEHSDGLIAVDAGLAAGVTVPRPQRRFAPQPADGPHGIAEALRAKGVEAGEVWKVVLTHLDWDHVGGVASFDSAEILVHRPEHEFATSFMGRQRCQPKLWPQGFDPTLFDLVPEQYGPFPASLPVTEGGDVRVVPLPGHSPGMVGVVVESDGKAILFAADHVMRQDWFVEDYAAGRFVGLGQFGRKEAVETSHRLHRFIHEVPTVLMPAHDAEAPERLAAMETVPPEPR